MVHRSPDARMLFSAEPLPTIKDSQRYALESVKKMKLEDVNEYGMRDLLSSTGQNEETLAFITCGGTYIPRIGTHDHRIIVQAVRTE